MRTFETGAVRDSEMGKFDYEGFLSPLALEAYAAYMHKNRFLKDGSLRDSDNWQKGFTKESYMKSLWRHFFALWKIHRGFGDLDSIHDAIGGILFNTFGYLHVLEKERHLQNDSRSVGSSSPREEGKDSVVRRSDYEAPHEQDY